MRDALQCRNAGQRRNAYSASIVAEPPLNLKGSSIREQLLPTIILTGFLGAGKTTVLDGLLKGNHGQKLGVIVNDLASVNIDASVLQSTMTKAGAKSVALSNGCVCCTGSGDLVETIEIMLREAKDIDAIVIELSGVAEPQRVSDLLERSAKGLPIRTVAVVDSPSFASDYMAQQPEAMKGKICGTVKAMANPAVDTKPQVHDQRWGSLLAEQIEAADLILLNKADVATDVEMQQALALTSAISPDVDVRITEQGCIDPFVFLGNLSKSSASRKPSSFEKVDKVADATQPKKCCVTGTCTSKNTGLRTLAEQRFGIKSFVYTADRPFSRFSLVMQLERWAAARKKSPLRLHLESISDKASEAVATGKTSDRPVDSPFSLVLRSKGKVWMDVSPGVAFYWSHAGRDVAFSTWGPWSEEEGAGTPHTEVVFIGAGMDEAAVRAALDSCLVPEKVAEP